MQALRFLFSPSGRLRPQTFILAAVAVYVAGAASQFLTRPDVIMRCGLWPFAATQVLLIWVWFVLHAKRLHDGGRPIGLAAGASVLYALSVALLLLLAASFYVPLAGQMPDANSASALGLILLVSIVAVLLGSPQYDVASLLVAILLVLAFVPLIVAVVVTLWAATRPSIEGDAA
jgi:uncharacterized membrane protein YhaH (DUF805 family)